MSRLTYTDEELAEFENMDCPVKANDLVNRFCDRVCDEFQSNCPFKELGKKLKAYEDKEEQGLLIELPCKVGDTVYLINHFMVDRKKKPIKCNVDDFSIDVSSCYAILNGSEAFYAMQRFRAVSIKEFGKTVFLTRSEAEETLAKMGGK